MSDLTTEENDIPSPKPRTACRSSWAHPCPWWGADGPVSQRSNASDHRCSEFLSAMTRSHPQDGFLLPMLSSPGSYILSTLFCDVFWAFVMLLVLFRAEYITVTYSRHFDHLWISFLTTAQGSKKFLWPRTRAALIYRYKHEYWGGSLTTCQFSSSSSKFPS